MSSPPKTERATLETIDEVRPQLGDSTPAAAIAPTVSVSQATPGVAPTISYKTEAGASSRSGDSSGRAALVLPTLGGYDIIDELGRGGMGVVYRAKQKGLDRLVAIKMLLAGEHAGAEHHARFKTEAQAVASLLHPNIVQIYEVAEHNGLPFFSLEFVPGGSLSRMIGGKPQPAAESARIVETIARAMQVAHNIGIVHRDLKPANILLAFGDHSSASALSVDATKQKFLAEGSLRNAIPKISDFGLAKRLELDSQQTRSGTIMGSPSYMAPEQARGEIKEVGPLADVYSIGTILYELLTGRPPFLAATAIDTVQQVVNAEPVAPSRLEPKVPHDLETICLKCLQKDPRKRYASAEALADDLGRFQRGEPILARPVSTTERLWRWCRRNPWLAGASAAAVLFLVVTATVSTWAAFTFANQNVIIRQEKEFAVKAKGLADDAREAADESAKTARGQATLAATTIQTLLDKVMTQIGDAPDTLKLKKELLETALEASEQLAETDTTTSKEATIISAHMKLGQLYQQSGDTEKAYEKFALVIAEARKRVKSEEGTDATRFNLAKTCVTMADASREFKRDMQACRGYIEEAIALYDDILTKPKPGRGAVAVFQLRFHLADAQNRLAVHLLRLGDPAAAFQQFRGCHELILRVAKEIDDPAQLDPLDDEQKKRATAEATRIRPLLSQYGTTALMGMGDMSFRLRRVDEADLYYRQVLEIREKSLADKPNDPAAKWGVSRICGTIGGALLQTRKLDDAEPLCQRALAILRDISDADPGRADYRRDFGVAQYRMGQLLLRQDKRDAAGVQFQECRALRQKLAEGNATNLKWQMDWKLAQAQCREHVAVTQFLSTIENDPKADTELLVLAARAYALCSAATDDPASTSDFRDKSFATLRRVLSPGYQDLFTLEMEPDFDPIRHDPRFAELVAQPSENGTASANSP